MIRLIITMKETENHESMGIRREFEFDNTTFAEANEMASIRDLLEDHFSKTKDPNSGVKLLASQELNYSAEPSESNPIDKKREGENGGSTA